MEKRCGVKSIDILSGLKALDSKRCVVFEDGLDSWAKGLIFYKAIRLTRGRAKQPLLQKG